MARYLLTGGRQRPSRFVRRDEWTSFEQALLLELDTDTGALRTLLEYTSPAENCPDVDPSILFKSASWDGDHLLLCTQTEVVVYDPARAAIVKVLSLPWFNDVHHAVRLDGRLHVVSTGLDAVFVLDDAGAVVEEFSATGASPWERFDRAADYRKVHTTKPHRAHPNYAFAADGRRWVTRFEQRDALPMDGGGPPIPVADAPIHDGEPHGGSLWFTAVNGQVLVADPRAGAVTARHDLNRFQPDGTPLGWCRGIQVEPDRVLVGFSRLRPSLFVQNLAWLRAPLKRPEPLPCRVTAYARDFSAVQASWTLESAGMSAVFSILPSR